MGPASRFNLQELVSSLSIGMWSLNASLASLARSLDMCCEWVCSLDLVRTIVRHTKERLQKEEKTTLLPRADVETPDASVNP